MSERIEAREGAKNGELGEERRVGIIDEIPPAVNRRLASEVIAHLRFQVARNLNDHSETSLCLWPLKGSGDSGEIILTFEELEPSQGHGVLAGPRAASQRKKTQGKLRGGTASAVAGTLLCLVFLFWQPAPETVPSELTSIGFAHPTFRSAGKRCDPHGRQSAKQRQ